MQHQMLGLDVGSRKGLRELTPSSGDARGSVMRPPPPSTIVAQMAS
jgi:hypothetical protein